MESYKKFRARMLKNKEFRKAYDALGPEFELIAATIRKRLADECEKGRKEYGAGKTRKLRSMQKLW